MPDIFLHGAEVVQIDDGIRPIQTIKSSVIGIVGTAPNALADTKASVTLGTGNAAILLTSKAVGIAGNAQSVQLVAPAGANAALGVVVSGSDITVNLATGAVAGVVTSTAAQVIAAINASGTANLLVTASNAAASTGASVAAAAAVQKLTGGVDEPFPLNTPVLISGPRQAAALGVGGTLLDAYTAVFTNGVSTMVVVRAAVGANAAETLSNVTGTPAAGTGVYALLNAQNLTGQKPKILAAPGFTSVTVAPASPVATALITAATKLRGVAIIDGPNTVEATALTIRALYGSDRAYMVDPAVRVWDAVTSTYVTRPASAYVAGIISRMDVTNGFWWSPSNQLVAGIVGTARPVTFGIADPDTEANRLNAAGVATIIRENGFRLWGNRTTATDANWAFLPVRRTADMIYESIEAAQLWAMDRPFSAQLLLDIRDSVQGYLNTLKALGATLGGKVWLDPELNTEATLKAGKLYLDFDIEPPAPLEHLTFRAHREGSYYEELVAAVTSTQ